MPTSPDPLDPLLDCWKEPRGPVPDLAPEVWRRIAHLENQRSEGLWSEAFDWLARPPFAAMFVVCCALVGLFLAEVRVNREQSEHSKKLALSYLQLIDPLLRERPNTPLP